MLQSLRLVNFQAHINSFVELDEGITSLTGESHEGKTAIMRGLNWAVNNEPSGTGFISYWAKHTTKKKLVVIDQPCKVECIREDGSILIRERSSEFNGYRIDGKNLARAGVGVPDEVKNWFNMGEVNIQSQHDSLFLLHPSGKGGQEVARFLNSVVKLDEIPRASSAIEIKKRAVKKLRDIETENIISYEKNIKSLGWILKAEPLLKRLEKIEKDIEDLENKETTIIEQIDILDGLDGILELFKWTKETSPLIDRWSLLHNKESRLLDNQLSINISLDSFKSNQQYLKTYKWVSKAEKIIFEIKEIEKEMNQNIQLFHTLEQKIKIYEAGISFLNITQPWLKDAADKIMQLEMLDHTIEELLTKKENIMDERSKMNTLINNNNIFIEELKNHKKQLPKQCPLCHSPWKGDKYENSR